MSIERIPTYCALCISRCGCLAVVEDGRLLRVEPDPDHPTGQGICIKARAAPELVGHPDRLTTPLVRTRAKGDADPGWQPISWDAALERIAEELSAVPARETAFAVTTPSGTAIADSFAWIHRLAHACGSPNLVFASENCNWHKDFSPALTWGAGIGMPDYERTACILLWGFNPSTTWLAHADEVRRAQKRGARLIVVDPRRAGLAAGADCWLAPRPGTDAALALGLIHLLLTDDSADAIDHDFLARFSDAADPAPDGRGGTVLERLAQRAAEYPPARVEQLTGVAVADLAAAARLLARVRPLSFFTWTGTCQQEQASDATRAINLLYALTGCIDAPGGNVWFEKPAVRDVAAFDWVTPATRQTTLGLAERPLGPAARGWITTRDLFRAIATQDPYPIRKLVSFGGNFQLTKPSTRHAEDALAGLDFFVQTELFHTPTTRWADMLLPVASCWEREGLQAGFMVSQAAESWVQLRPAVVTPPGEARPDEWIVFELARRLGHAERFFDGDRDAALTHIVEPLGLAPAALRAQRRGVRVALETRYRKYEHRGFATASGKLQLWSTALQRAGYDPLPAYHAPEMAAAYPHLLTCGKIVPYCHSQQRQLPSLRRRAPEPLAELAPDVAAAAGVADGERIVIVTRSGSMHARARIAETLAPGTVWAQYGWWDESEPVAYNACCDGEAYDPPSGSNALRGVACRVERHDRPHGG